MVIGQQLSAAAYGSLYMDLKVPLNKINPIQEEALLDTSGSFEFLLINVEEYFWASPTGETV